MSLHLCHPVQTFPRRGSLFTIIYFDQENPKIQKVIKLLAMPLQLCHSVHASPKIGQSVAYSYLYSKHSENTHLKSLSLSFQFALLFTFELICLASMDGWIHTLVRGSFNHETFLLLLARFATRPLRSSAPSPSSSRWIQLSKKDTIAQM